MPEPDEPALRAWLADTEAAWRGRGVAPAYKFWRARSAEQWGAESARSAVPAKPGRGVVDIDAEVAAMRAMLPNAGRTA